MNPEYPGIVIGAGPAGLMAASASAGPCLILEAGPRPGRKLLLSGSGQCNFTHDLELDEFLKRCGSYARFLKPALYKLSPAKLIGYLNSLGCQSIVRPDGKVFPASLDAKDVLAALLRGALKPGNQIISSARITHVSIDKGFVLTDNHQRLYRCRKLLIATGGASWPQTGSDGSGYELARQLGHKLIEPRPALASILIDAYPFRTCAGIALSGIKAELLTQAGKHRVSGDLLFTHRGLSGPLVLDHSHLLAQGDTIRLCYLEDAAVKLRQIMASRPKSSLKNALKTTGLPEALLLVLITMAKVNPDKRCADVSAPELKSLGFSLSSSDLKLKSVECLSTAMLSAGGIDLGEVRARDMSSCLVPGLYFAGEVLDYNLPTGGFNIQAACSTGFLAGSQ